MSSTHIVEGRASKKAQRAALREMFSGRCAYCGSELGERWHADHVEPVMRELRYERGKGFVPTGAMHMPHRDTPANMMPACAPCNIDKHAMSLEDWRGKLSRSLEVLARNNATYRHAVRFGLVEERPREVRFYFEGLIK